MLGIWYEDIEQFSITNPEIPPDTLGNKFCRLDVNMTVDGQRVNLEIQVKNEHDFPECSLFYWAREYSTALGEGGDYMELPRVVIISIVAFKLYDCKEVHSEYRPLEVTRHTQLTDKMALHYYELPKLPETACAEDGLLLWLKLFDAETEEDLKKIESLEAPVMKQAIGAYRSITATEEFKELERLRSRARHNEAAALRNARLEERAKWQGVLDAVLADKDAVLADKDAALADKDAALADKEAEIAQLRALLNTGMHRKK
jgi:predicted transposase/invertase (TIGR01784 family)